MNFNLTDVANRALKTFAQSALSVLAAAGSGFVDVAVWKGACVAGGAAVISYLWNTVKK